MTSSILIRLLDDRRYSIPDTRIDYKLALLVYKCPQDVAPSYRTADIEARHRLRSASSPSLVVRRTRLSTYGDRAFPVAASRVWNSLPHHVTSAQSLPVFCSRLKTHLFRRSFRWLYCCACEVTLVITDTLIDVLTYLLTRRLFWTADLRDDPAASCQNYILWNKIMIIIRLIVWNNP